MQALASLWRGWEGFWFRPADPTPLGFIRICGGLVVLYVHLVYTLDLGLLIGPNAWMDKTAAEINRTEYPIRIMSWDWAEPKLPSPGPDDVEFFQKWGADPRMLYTKGMVTWSLWFHVQDPFWVGVMHGLVLLVMVLFTVGFCTRVTSALTWLAALSYIQRSPSTVFGMDTIMNIMLLYLTIGPSGATLSVDRWLASRRARREGRTLPPPEPSVLANFALRLMQVHFCIVYLSSGLSKLQGGAWWNGTALWGTMANPEFAPLHLEWYEGFIVFLCRNRWLWELVMASGVVFTLVMEIGFPFLVWDRRIRWLMVLGAVLLHMGIAMTMGLMTFGLMMLSLLASFVPAETIRQFVDTLLETGRSFVGGATPAAQRRAA